MTLRLVWKKIIWFVTRSWKESNKISHISQNISSVTLHTCILKLECGILNIISIGDISLRTFRNCKQKNFPYNYGHTALTHVNILNLTQIKHRRESLQFLIKKNMFCVSKFLTINRTVLQFCMHYKAGIHSSVSLTQTLTTIACNSYFLGGLMYVLVSVKGPVLRGRRNFVSLDLIDCIPSNICACIVSSNGMFLFSCIPLHTCAYFSL